MRLAAWNGGEWSTTWKCDSMSTKRTYHNEICILPIENLSHSNWGNMDTHRIRIPQSIITFNFEHIHNTLHPIPSQQYYSHKRHVLFQHKSTFKPFRANHLQSAFVSSLSYLHFSFHNVVRYWCIWYGCDGTQPRAEHCVEGIQCGCLESFSRKGMQTQSSSHTGGRVHQAFPRRTSRWKSVCFHIRTVASLFLQIARGILQIADQASQDYHPRHCGRRSW